MRNCCGVEPIIKTSNISVEGDNSPNTETKVYTVLVLSCPNENCKEHGKEYEEKIQTYPEARA
jgi:hypothetical protein